LPTANVFEIQEGDVVFVERAPGAAVVLAFRADENLTVRAGSSVDYRLKVKGEIGPAPEVASIDIESRLWLNSVTVTTIGATQAVFDLNDVEHLGATLRLRLVEPIAKVQLPRY
jgi:hypothetical protein